ncbi:membrane-associated HD superfamily phosphohydrolase [Planomicrobium stackebrandtii]|uniref:Membrane-associated HD superfamily phosphohydrolase n=1 Tax=Planomicrobium stackebrandtii TaxID=253160 RepID=A0ABU0GQ45_9BACL|nr:hypothetical protein [Planomicrobium stackebrandtii]MDQ0427193.1 membrane-associated HD superfamily phosphohydrolase [Planomicrobium stackebrandtii]
MNIFGLLSLLMFVISVTAFLIMRGPDGDIYLTIIVLSTLSVIGVLFAVLSKQLLWKVLGIVVNLIPLLFAFLLLFAMGISEP